MTGLVYGDSILVMRFHSFIAYFFISLEDNESLFSG